LPASSYDASIPFNLSFTSFSLGLFAAPLSHSRTFAILTECVTDGLRDSTSIVLAGPGAQSCSRNDWTASATASYSVSACTDTAWRIPSWLGSAATRLNLRHVAGITDHGIDPSAIFIATDAAAALAATVAVFGSLPLIWPKPLEVLRRQ
jgi:hypothetical protein